MTPSILSIEHNHNVLLVTITKFKLRYAQNRFPDKIVHQNSTPKFTIIGHVRPMNKFTLDTNMLTCSATWLN